MTTTAPTTDAPESFVPARLLELLTDALTPTGEIPAQLWVNEPQQLTTRKGPTTKRQVTLKITDTDSEPRQTYRVDFVLWGDKAYSVGDRLALHSGETVLWTFNADRLKGRLYQDRDGNDRVALEFGDEPFVRFNAPPAPAKAREDGAIPKASVATGIGLPDEGGQAAATAAERDDGGLDW